jgi:hypothetical protein
LLAQWRTTQPIAQCAQPLLQVTAMAPLVPVRPLQDQPGGAPLGKNTNAAFVKLGTLS